MHRLITWPLSLVALFVFTDVARQYLPALLEPLFQATAEEPFVLSLLLCLFLVTFFAATWIWSARSRRH